MTWVAPRTWVASEVVTAAIMNQHVRDNLLALQDRLQRIRKVNDTSLTSVTALANDAELKFTAVAGQSYLVQAALIVTSAVATADLQCAFSFPAGTMAFGIMGQDTAATTNTSSGVFNGSATATSGTTAFTVGVISGVTFVNIAGSFLCTTGGTVNMMFAQGASIASAVNVKGGSALWADRVTA